MIPRLLEIAMNPIFSFLPVLSYFSFFHLTGEYPSNLKINHWEKSLHGRKVLKTPRAFWKICIFRTSSRDPTMPVPRARSLLNRFKSLWELLLVHGFRMTSLWASILLNRSEWRITSHWAVCTNGFRGSANTSTNDRPYFLKALPKLTTSWIIAPVCWPPGCRTGQMSKWEIWVSDLNSIVIKAKLHKITTIFRSQFYRSSEMAGLRD